MHDQVNCDGSAHLSIRVGEHKSFERSRQVRVKAGSGRYVIQLGSTNCSDHPDVGAGVLEPGSERSDKILDQVRDTEGAEAAECEAPDGWVLVAAIALEEVDSEEREVRVRACVGADVEVAHLLGDDVRCRGAHHHLTERRGHVDAGGHARDHPFEDIPALVVRVRRTAPRQLPQLLLQIRHFALPALTELPIGRSVKVREGGRLRKPGREGTAYPEGWEGEADFAAVGTVGAIAVVRRAG